MGLPDLLWGGGGWIGKTPWVSEGCLRGGGDREETIGLTG